MVKISRVFLSFEKHLKYNFFKQRTFFIYALGLFLIFQFGAGFTVAQKKTVEQTKKQISPKTTSVKCSADDNSKTLYVRTYLEKIKSYKNQLLKGKSIIELSTLLWKCDEEFSRNSFVSLSEKLGNEIESAKNKKNNNVTNTEDEVRKLNAIIGLNRYLQQYLIMRLQTLDKLLAKQLSKNFTSAEKGFVDFLSLLEGDYSTNSLSLQRLNEIRQIMRNSPISETVPFLTGLRKSNAIVADQLFSELLNLSKENPNLSFNDLMILGTYFYMSRIFINSDDDSHLYSYLPVRGVRVIDLTAKRSFTNGNSTVPYLSLIIKFLLTPVIDLTERTQRYVFGRIMLSHIISDAPELTNSMIQALILHFDGVPDIFKSENFYEQFKKINNPSEPDYFERNLQDVEKTIGSDNRDDKAIRLAGSLYTKAQYERIEKVAEYISNLDKRNSVLDISRYRQAIKLLENNETDKAEIILKKITNASLKAIIGFRLLQDLQENKKNDVNLPEQYVYNVIENANKSDDEYAPIILLALAKIVYKKDEGLGYNLINSAIKKLNNNKNWKTPKWRIEIPTPTIGVPSISFSMKKIQGLNLSQPLDFLIKESENNLEELIQSIEDETVQSEAILLFVKYYLTQTRKNTVEVKNNDK